MITITNKTDCCGCGACASRCVTSCITMAPDEEGFNYPLVDTDKCIHCGLCERVCPLLHKPQPHEILAVIGCKNKNEAVRFVSSSGGFFSLAAEKILGRQGTVFGAAFDDNWHVRHIAVTSGNAMNYAVPNMYKAISALPTRTPKNCFRQAILFYSAVRRARSEA